MMVTRLEALTRANTIWTPGTVLYSQSTIHQPDGYRQDCSGYVSMCWKLPLVAPGSWGGQNTVSLVTLGYMVEIPADELQPGDAVGLCGPGTAGDDGHIQLFDHWLNDDPDDSRYYCWQQAGGRRGPTHDLENWPDGYKAYRYVGITEEDDDMTPEERAWAHNASSILYAMAGGLDEAEIMSPWNDPVHGPPGTKYRIPLAPYWARIAAEVAKLSGVAGPVDLTEAAVAEVEAAAFRGAQRAEDA